MGGPPQACSAYPSLLSAGLPLCSRPKDPDRTQTGQADPQRPLCRQFLGRGLIEEVRIQAADPTDRGRTQDPGVGGLARDADRRLEKDSADAPAAGGAVRLARPGGLPLAYG